MKTNIITRISLATLVFAGFIGTACSSDDEQYTASMTLNVTKGDYNYGTRSITYVDPNDPTKGINTTWATTDKVAVYKSGWSSKIGDLSPMADKTDGNKTKLDGHRVCCVGVSTARATETAVGTDGLLKEFEGWTNKFIFPPYEFGMCNAMIGNFYHPESTMMMSECSFGGYDLVYEGYKKAVKNGYKFGCYGDAMLILDD